MKSDKRSNTAALPKKPLPGGSSPQDAGRREPAAYRGREDNEYLYMWEGIACMMVVLIHCRFPGRAGDFAAAYARFAVPLFFAVSGWFFFDSPTYTASAMDTDNIREKSLSRLVRLGPKTAGIWLAYTVYSLLRHLLAGESALFWLRSKFSPGEWKVFLMFNSGKVIYDWTYVYDHLWFAFALMYVYVLLYVFAPLLHKWMKPLCVLLLMLLFFGELLQIYYPVRPFDISIRTWYMLRNWLLEGLPFVLLGMSLKKKRTGKGWLLIVAGLLSTTAEFLLFGEMEVHVGSVMTAAGILLQAGAVPRQKRTAISRIGRYCAGSVYYWHILVWALINFAWPENHLHQWFAWLKPGIVFAGALIPSALKYYALHRRSIHNQ